MKSELGLVSESEGALIARKGLLSSVDPDVALQSLQVPEPCSADLAWVRLLASMDQHVCAEMSDLNKTRRAGIALVRFFAGMNTQVRFQVGRTVELRVTDRTLVWLHSRFFFRFCDFVLFVVSILADFRHTRSRRFSMSYWF